MASPAAILQVFVNANTKVASAQLAAFEKQLQGVGKMSAATGGGMGKFTKGAAAAGTGIAAFGVLAGIAGKQLYDLGKQFDEAYDTIRVRTGATGKELEKLKRDFRAVATTVPDDFKTVGEAIGGLNQRLGASGKPLRQLSTQMLNLSRLTGTDLDSNIKSVSKAFVDFEVPVKRQRRSLDGLFRLYQKSGASVDELASSVQRFGSPLRTLGFSFEEAAAMFANFERAGVNTQTMVPGLKLAIGNLVKPTDQFANTMRQLGVVCALTPSILSCGHQLEW
jgi:TP901 family phage tail tape measure protein